MRVADAVLASCAVQPFIACVELEEDTINGKGVQEKITHKFYSASPKITFPFDFALRLHKRQKSTVPFVSLFHGVLTRSTENKVAMPHYLFTESKKGQAKKEKSANEKDPYRILSLTRAAPTFDTQFGQHVKFF
jgi:hypothetical protein